MTSFSEGSSKCTYSDSPFGCSHTISKFHMLWLCSFGLKKISLISSSPQIDRSRMAMVWTLAGNDDDHTPMSLYSLYEDISGDSV